MDKREYKDMWVGIEHEQGRIEEVSLELCCQIRKLADLAGEKLAAVVAGELPESQIARILDCGVDKLIQVEGSGYEQFSADAYTELYTVLCRKHRPSAVFIGGTSKGRDFAPRFAARLETGCTSDSTELVYNMDSGDIEFIEPAVGGRIMAVISIPELRPQVATIRPGTFKYQPAGRRYCQLLKEKLDFDPGKARSRRLEFIEESRDDSLDIREAQVIVCVGKAVKADSLPLYKELADRLGGKLACTRPVFDRGLLPYKLVIGQSGFTVRPKLLLSFGVSGAINHVTGFSDAGMVVAINTDPSAAIFNCADYGMVADMDEVCKLILERLQPSV